MTSDSTLIQACVRGNRKAQNELYHRHVVQLFGLCMRFASTRQEAEDMLMEGFFQIFKDLHQYRLHSPLSAWMRRVMINAALMHLRKKRRRALEILELDSIPEPTSTDDFGFQQDTKAVIEAIQQLPEGYRIIFNLYAIEGFSHKEIAAQLNISGSTSRSQYTRAKAALQKLLIQQEVL